MLDSVERFTGRVQDYIRARPGYPPEVVDTLAADCGLTSASVVADIGSGTGILTRLLLERGCEVFGVEPNDEMRQASASLLAGHPRFHAVSGRAEATSLPARSMDLAVAGQSFHWFDRDRARVELKRILQPGGYVVLIWNSRHTGGTPFLVAYERLLRRFATEYERVTHERIDPTIIADFFGAGGFREKGFPNRQTLDAKGLEGRLLSSSYAPGPGHAQHRSMLDELAHIFRSYEVDGTVRLDYTTKMYYGRL